MRRLNLDAQVSLQCRFEMVTPAFLDALEGLNVQLEFGLQTVIPEEYKAIGRPNNLRKVEHVVHELHRRDLDFEVSLIYGLPHQTLDSFKRSIEWCENNGIPRLRAWPLMLLRGTPLYDQKHQFGFKESIDQRIPIVIASDSFTEDEYRSMADLADSQEKRWENL
jgi:coproporphyrinogen III oxidase-like Fe-S oxidoreductase